jgi:hypothetical protein
MYVSNLALASLLSYALCKQCVRHVITRQIYRDVQSYTYTACTTASAHHNSLTSTLCYGYTAALLRALLHQWHLQHSNLSVPYMLSSLRFSLSPSFLFTGFTFDSFLCSCSLALGLLSAGLGLCAPVIGNSACSMSIEVCSEHHAV